MEVKKEVEKAKGNLPAKDDDVFKEILDEVISQWNLDKPVDVMVANRMVARWMQVKYVQCKLNQYGLVFETKEGGKVIGLKVNELAYYLKQLESEFRSYYRMLQGKAPAGSGNPTETFATWLEDKENVSDNRTSKKRHQISC